MTAIGQITDGSDDGGDAARDAFEEPALRARATAEAELVAAHSERRQAAAMAVRHMMRPLASLAADLAAHADDAASSDAAADVQAALNSLDSAACALETGRRSSGRGVNASVDPAPGAPS